MDNGKNIPVMNITVKKISEFKNAEKNFKIQII